MDDSSVRILEQQRTLELLEHVGQAGFEVVHGSPQSVFVELSVQAGAGDAEMPNHLGHVPARVV